MHRAADFHGVEILDVGTHQLSTGEWVVTEDVIDEIAAAYASLGDRWHAPLKLGHDEQTHMLPAGMPAAGWVENLRRAGTKLIADLLSVPEAIAALIRGGSYRSRSVEVQCGLEVDGKTYPHVLTGLSLLGAELPGVKTLADIVDLFGSGAALASSARPGIATTDGRLVLAADETTTERNMDRALICEKLGLADTATDEEIMAALDALLDAATAPAPDSGGGDDEYAMKASAPVLAAEAKIAALTARIEAGEKQARDREVGAIIDGAIAEGRYPVAERERLVKLGAVQSPDELRAFLGTLPPCDLGVLGTGAHSSDASRFEPTPGQRRMAQAMGIKESTLVSGGRLLAGLPAKSSTGA